MSAMKNLIENLRGIQLCMADITRTMNLNDVESPLAMHGAPSRVIKSATDARTIAAELDMRALAGALDDGQIESISEQVQVDYCELATEISTEGLARYVDCAEVAQHIRADAIVTAMLANTRFMDALADAVMARVTLGATMLRPAAAPVPAVRSDADPLTGIEYGTPS